jgi:hypothetical protein
MKKSKVQKIIFFVFLISVFMLNINIENSKIDQALKNKISIENSINQAWADSEGYCATSCTGSLCPNNKHTRYDNGKSYCCERTYSYVGSACPN